MSRSPEERPSGSWFVMADGRAWGPYPKTRIDAFVEEGRVAAATLLSDAPNGWYQPAVEHASFRHLFETRRAPATAISEVQPHQRPATPSEVSPAQPLLVFATLDTLEDAAFHAALSIYGPAHKVRPGLWLVRARLGPAALRNALSRKLKGGDTLLVVQAGLDQTAWFNLDPDEERQLRILWNG